MPLLDHFHPPLHPDHHWESFHSNWATRIADALNERWLPEEFLAEEHTHAGARWEIDIATFEGSTTSVSGAKESSTATIAPPAYAPPEAAMSIPAVFPDSFEVRVFQTTAGRTLVAAIELVSPGNKDRPQQRRAFAAKCASYLYQGVSVVVVDIVTNRMANLHNDLMQLMEADASAHMRDHHHLYATAYRRISQDDDGQIDIWTQPCRLGEGLPDMPLGLSAELVVPVELESTYTEACRRRRIG